MQRGERRLLGGERRGLSLRRTADGRLRPANEESSIADVWAEQKRIQLKDSIDEQKRRALKKQRRRERAQGEIEIRLSLPHLRKPSMEPLKRLGHAAAAKARAGGRVTVLVLGMALLVAGVLSIKAFGGGDGDKQAAKGEKTLSQSAVLSGKAEQPDFDTVLPLGKTIEDLGGWGRVSPPDRDPVFAYSDTLSDVHIVVSQQPLPDDFVNDPKAGAATVAKQFNASRKLTTTEGGVVYVGTANNGAQSVVTTKKNLLILIRSSSVIGDEIWSSYVYALE